MVAASDNWARDGNDQIPRTYLFKPFRAGFPTTDWIDPGICGSGSYDSACVTTAGCQASTAMIKVGMRFPLPRLLMISSVSMPVTDHHSRNDAADRISLFFPTAEAAPEFPDHMPGDADVANHIKSGVHPVSHPVSKSDDQHRFFPFSHQTFQMFCQFLRYFPVIIPHPVPTYSGLPW